jgi:hypothetical protein
VRKSPGGRRFEEIGVQALNLLRLCIGSMGMAPVDASKVSWAPPDDDDDDIFDK